MNTERTSRIAQVVQNTFWDIRDKINTQTASKELRDVIKLLPVDKYSKTRGMDAAHLIEYRKSIKHFSFALAVDAAAAEYQYKRNKTTETAKVLLERLEYLLSTYSKKLSKRSRLNILYNKADILAELGEYESATKNYKIVAKNGGGLWIAEDSREKLAKIEKSE